MRQGFSDQGVHGMGSPNEQWSAEEVAALIEELTQRHLGKDTAITVTRLKERMGFDIEGGRGERNLVSQLDGVAFLLGEWNTGYYTAEWQEEAEAGNHRLESQINEMTERLERRREYLEAHPLPKKQQGMF